MPRIFDWSKTEGPSEGRERGWGSWEVVAIPSPPPRGLGSAVNFSQRGSGRSSDRPKVFRYFEHSKWPGWLDYHAVIGGA